MDDVNLKMTTHEQTIILLCIMTRIFTLQESLKGYEDSDYTTPALEEAKKYYSHELDEAKRAYEVVSGYPFKA